MLGYLSNETMKISKIPSANTIVYFLVAGSILTHVFGNEGANGPSQQKFCLDEQRAICQSENETGAKPDPETSITEEEENLTRDHVEGWGKFVNPAGDCSFKNSTSSGVLKIIVPGSENPHDLSPELRSMTAPRVLQTVEGDFKVQVKVIGDFEPGSDSTQAGRTGYNGAGLVIFADEKNFVRLERATLHRIGGSAQAYTNFEIRENGFLKQQGSTADFQTSDNKPTWLRLERRGNKMHGAMSQDGITWIQANPMPLDPEFWNNDQVEIGVAAVSTSRQNFTPVFSGFSVEPKKESQSVEKSKN